MLELTKPNRLNVIATIPNVSKESGCLVCAAGHDQYKAWASLLKTDCGLYMVGGSHTETSIEFKKGAVGCLVSRKR